MGVVNFPSVLIVLIEVCTNIANGFIPVQERWNPMLHSHNVDISQQLNENKMSIFIGDYEPKVSLMHAAALSRLGVFHNNKLRSKRSSGGSQVSKRNLDATKFQLDAALLDQILAEESSDSSESRGKRVINSPKGKLWSQAFENIHPKGRPVRRFPTQMMKDEDYDIGSFYDLLRALRESPNYDDIEQEIGKPDLSLVNSQSNGDSGSGASTSASDKSDTNLDISVELVKNLCALQDEYDSTRKVPSSTQPNPDYLEKYNKNFKDPGDYGFVWIKCAQKGTDKKPCGWYELNKLD